MRLLMSLSISFIALECSLRRPFAKCLLHLGRHGGKPEKKRILQRNATHFCLLKELIFKKNEIFLLGYENNYYFCSRNVIEINQLINSNNKQTNKSLTKKVQTNEKNDEKLRSPCG